MANMFIQNSNYLLFIVVHYLVFCFETHALDYDRSFTTECLPEPLPPQYGGGLVANSELNDQGIRGQPKVSFDVKLGTHIAFSAWLRSSHGKLNIAAVLKTETEEITIGQATARNSCWSMLKGGLTPETSGPAELYFTVANDDTELEVDDRIWAASLSVQPFTDKQWKAHQLSSIEKVRKNNVRVQVLGKDGQPVANASISLTQSRGDFPFGCAINSNILGNPQYQSWFLQRFKNRVTVFENELKWYSTEYNRGMEDYSTADKLFAFAESNGMKIRGHNVLWDTKEGLPRWVQNLSGDELRTVTTHRINSVMTKYKNRVIHWDVLNEDLHGNFFEQQLNDLSVATKFYQMAQGLDPSAIMFMNEYNTIECPQDVIASPQAYINRIAIMKSEGYTGSLGVGLEGHFPYANLASIRASLDRLVSSGASPIWITELDVKSGYGLGDIINELFAYPAVEGILLWSPWHPEGCYAACLTDNSFHNLPAGNDVDNFLAGLSHTHDSELRGRTTDANGFLELPLHHGDYKLKIKSPTATRLGRYSIKRIHVRRNHTDSKIHRVTIHHMH